MLTNNYIKISLMNDQAIKLSNLLRQVMASYSSEEMELSDLFILDIAEFLYKEFDPIMKELLMSKKTDPTILIFAYSPVEAWTIYHFYKSIKLHTQEFDRLIKYILNTLEKQLKINVIFQNDAA